MTISAINLQVANTVLPYTSHVKELKFLKFVKNGLKSLRNSLEDAKNNANITQLLTHNNPPMIKG